MQAAATVNSSYVTFTYRTTRPKHTTAKSTLVTMYERISPPQSHLEAKMFKVSRLINTKTINMPYLIKFRSVR